MSKTISSKVIKVFILLFLIILLLLSIAFALVGIFQEKNGQPSLANIFVNDLSSWASITENSDRIKSAYAFFIGIILITVAIIILILIIIRIIKMQKGKKELTLTWLITFTSICILIFVGSVITYKFSVQFFDNYQARLIF